MTTSVGRFKIGWRKRVIQIDWTETVGTDTALKMGSGYIIGGGAAGAFRLKKVEDVC